MPTAKKIFVANWKENKNFSQGVLDFKQLLDLLDPSRVQNNQVVICPPSPFLPVFREILSGRPQRDFVRLGCQDVSQFEEGSFTGEVSVRLLRDLAHYAIIGHSERRQFLGESEEAVCRKTDLCFRFDIVPLVCFSRVDQLRSLVPVAVRRFLVAFEPLAAIGSGRAESPEVVRDILGSVKGIFGEKADFLYGGSVGRSNVRSYLEVQGVAGVLVGGASLASADFSQIVSQS